MRTHSLPILAPHQTVGESLIVITRARLGMGIVESTSRPGHVVGLITDGDLRRAMQKHQRVLELPVRDIMTPCPVTIGPDAKFEEADGGCAH